MIATVYVLVVLSANPYGLTDRAYQPGRHTLASCVRAVLAMPAPWYASEPVQAVCEPVTNP